MTTTTNYIIIFGLLLFAVFGAAYLGAYLAITGAFYPAPTPTPNITSWGNDHTLQDLTVTINTTQAVRFNATANQTIDTWNWFKDGVNQSNNYDNLTPSKFTPGTHTVKVNATNTHGTSGTITWTITVYVQGLTYCPACEKYKRDNALGIPLSERRAELY